jgi:cytochrome c-type biogenesis protein CcmH
MILGILVVILTLAAAAALTRPWWSAALARRMTQTGANVAAYRLRLAEIEQEVRAGSIDRASADAMKAELQHRLLQDAEEGETVPKAATTSSWKVAAVVGVFLPLFSGIWYFQAGSWRLADQLARAPATSSEQIQAAQIEGMVQRLAQRLQQQPDDADGWAMLGRSYFVLKRYPESAQAYGRANALMQPPDPDLLVSEGGALALAADSDLGGRPRELFDQALALSPDHPRALWFAGQAALQAGDPASAQTHWERLLKQELPEELRAEVAAHVHELSARTGRPAVAAAAPATGPSLRVKVALDPAIAAKRKPGQVLYVFAKAERGPPMPLAVQKVQPERWPVELTLDESMSMSPALKLSQFDRWVVTARLGGEGSPTAQSGDLQGRTLVTRGASPQNVEVVISEQVP